MKNFSRRSKIFVILAVAIVVVLAIVLSVRKTRPKGDLILYGNVDIRQVDLGFRVMGRVVTMVFEEGDLVTAGQLMAVLDKQPYEDSVKQAAARLSSSKASLENAKLLLQRRSNLIDLGGVSQEDLDDSKSNVEVLEAGLNESTAALASATTSYQDTEIHAPSNGSILTRIREPGSVVGVGDPVYTLSLDNPIWVRAYVSETNLGRIYPGMPAEVYTDTPSNPVYKGHIGFISPVAEFTPKTVETTSLRTDLVYRLRVIVDNPDRTLKQGMPVTVILKRETPKNG